MSLIDLIKDRIKFNERINKPMEQNLERTRMQHESESEAHPDPRCGNLLDNGECLKRDTWCPYDSADEMEKCIDWVMGND